MRSLKTGTEADRATIEKDVRKFLKAGNKIQQIPVGMSKEAARNLQWKAMSIDGAYKAGLR
ncbi:hypothetical protein A3765_28395 [Oleiphilus sp. HI0130]|nr:hypothetical protein A3765_28705 [Oleiphilus sp. HI0130]KZZ72472.1 hypothetical protein A3765_28395 [Oleiphilus sp. HI0130]